MEIAKMCVCACLCDYNSIVLRVEPNHRHGTDTERHLARSSMDQRN